MNLDYAELPSASMVDDTSSPPRFIAARCAKCGTVAFPRRRRCASCRRTEFGDVLLDPLGTVYSYTIVHLGRAGTKTPYGIGVVDFSHGVRIVGRLYAWDAVPRDKLIGSDVVAALDPDDGTDRDPRATFRMRILAPAPQKGVNA